MLDLEDLRTFVTAVRAGSFAKAARLLGVTPAMVGRRVQALEQGFGVRLIERTTRAQRLTETGEAVLARAESVLDAAADLEELSGGGPGPLEGRIRMTGPATLGAYRLAELVAGFCDDHPGVTLEVSLNDRRVDLIAEGFDLAVRVGELPASTMIARLVGSYRMVLVAAPGYLQRHGTPLSPASLAAHRCLLNLNMQPRNRWPFHARDGRVEVAEIEGTLQIDNGEAHRAACLAEAGIAYVPVDLVADDIAAGRLYRLLPDWTAMVRPIQLVMPSRRVPRRVSALADWLAAGLRQSHPIEPTR